MGNRVEATFVTIAFSYVVFHEKLTKKIFHRTGFDRGRNTSYDKKIVKNSKLVQKAIQGGIKYGNVFSGQMRLKLLQ